MSVPKHIEAFAKLASANPIAFREVCEWLDAEHDKRLASLIVSNEFGAMRFEQGRMRELITLRKSLGQAKELLTQA